MTGLQQLDFKGKASTLQAKMVGKSINEHMQLDFKEKASTLQVKMVGKSIND